MGDIRIHINGEAEDIDEFLACMALTFSAKHQIQNHERVLVGSDNYLHFSTWSNIGNDELEDEEL